MYRPILRGKAHLQSQHRTNFKHQTRDDNWYKSVGFCHPRLCTREKNIYPLKMCTHDEFEILAKHVPIGLLGTHRLLVGFISNILVLLIINKYCNDY
jgi:hypothetical protein